MIVDIRPRRVELYTTSKWLKKNASQVRKATGADVVINATLYNASTWRPCCDVKQNGKILSNDPYGYRGIGWNSDGVMRPALSSEMGKYSNFISCAMLVYLGKALPICVTPDVGRSSGRTAVIGMKDGSLKLWCVKEGTMNQTPKQLQNSILAIPNVDWALMLDGGGSSQLSQDGSKYIYSTRKVQNYLCFWQSDNEPEGAKPMVEINAYSKKNDGGKKLSTNFSVKEFACNDGSDAILVAPRLVMILQTIRSHFGKAVTINSAYRTPTYNAKVGGVAHSQHCYGTAADISISGVTPSQVAAFARSIMPDWGGVGMYSTFCHVDVRENKADWNG